MREHMTFLEIKNLKPLLDENGRPQSNDDGVLILEDGLPALSQKEIEKHKSLKIPKRVNVDFMEGKTPDPIISEEQARNIVEGFIKAQEKENKKPKYDEDGFLNMKEDILDK